MEQLTRYYGDCISNDVCLRMDKTDAESIAFRLAKKREFISDTSESSLSGKI